MRTRGEKNRGLSLPKAGEKVDVGEMTERNNGVAGGIARLSGLRRDSGEGASELPMLVTIGKMTGDDDEWQATNSLSASISILHIL